MKSGNKHNRNLLIATYIFLAVFVGLIAYLIYFTVHDADGVINNTYNKRQDILSEKVVKGSILSSDGEILAQTVTDEEGNETRYYPYANVFSHVIGYLNNGGYGLENNACYYMLSSNENPFEKIVKDLKDEKLSGDNVVTTLNAQLQQIAYNALGSNRGAVIVTEPSTGKILAMVSKPDFNPNTLADNWDAITAEGGDSVLVNRATQGLYPPGSTFKIVTLLEYIRENPLTYKSYSYDCTGAFDLDGTIINCVQNTAHGTEDTALSFAYSCNSSFINMGLTLDIESYKKTAEELLFNSELPLDMEYNRSSFSLTEDSSLWEKAVTSFGQGNTLITPMHLALIGSAIANGGVLMKPLLMDHIENVNSTTVKKFRSSVYGKMMSEDEAEILRENLENVINTSFGWLFGDCEYTVAGKSGTAQYGTLGYEHSLFVSFSPAQNPEICVTVVVEGGEQRTCSAAEIARVIYDYYYTNMR